MTDIASTISDDDQLLTPVEVSALLRSSQRELARMHHEGRGPPRLKLGHRTVRYQLRMIRCWLKNENQHALKAKKEDNS